MFSPLSGSLGDCMMLLQGLLEGQGETELLESWATLQGCSTPGYIT